MKKPFKISRIFKKDMRMIELQLKENFLSDENCERKERFLSPTKLE